MRNTHLAAILALFITSLLPLSAFAQNGLQIAPQDQRWIQIEALSTLSEAQTRVQQYTSRLQHVNGFRINSQWYGIVLGPYDDETVTPLIRLLKDAGLIPQDSFVTFTRKLKQQFWPVARPVVQPNTQTQSLASPLFEPQPQAQFLPQSETGQNANSTPLAIQETKAEARRSEQLLNRDQRKALQRALKWDGFYTSAIDGAFGPGTRRSMSDWQLLHRYDPTGILTTSQRAQLLSSYQEAVAALGMAPFENEQLGIAVLLPSAMVDFDHIEAPFAHFNARSAHQVSVHLISQTGTQETLYGLYDILQSLEIIPLEGPRQRLKSTFTIEGANSEITSYAQASLIDGAIKGFILTWPKNDEKRRQRVLDDMRASFRSLGSNALPDTAGLDGAMQSRDLLAGLVLRKPDRSRSGFYVNNKGAILTAAHSVENCSRITINDDFQAEVTSQDPQLGLALLTPKTTQSPLGFASFLTTPPLLTSSVAVSGYSYEGRLNAPSITFGFLSELEDLNGDSLLNRLEISTFTGDIGGPVFDSGGAVTGVLLPMPSIDGRQLPDAVHFALNSKATQSFLTEQGITIDTTDIIAQMDLSDLSAHAADMTVLVSCWN